MAFCPGCTTRFDAGINVPLLLDCAHTLCRSCVTEISSSPGSGRCCPLCRHPIEGPASKLRVNHALAEAIQASGAEVRELMERWGLGDGGAGSVVLPPDDLTLEELLASQPGATCQVWKGRLRGQVRQDVAAGDVTAG